MTGLPALDPEMQPVAERFMALTKLIAISGGEIISTADANDGEEQAEVKQKRSEDQGAATDNPPKITLDVIMAAPVGQVENVQKNPSKTAHIRERHHLNQIVLRETFCRTCSQSGVRSVAGWPT